MVLQNEGISLKLSQIPMSWSLIFFCKAKNSKAGLQKNMFSLPVSHKVSIYHLPPISRKGRNLRGFCYTKDQMEGILKDSFTYLFSNWVPKRLLQSTSILFYVLLLFFLWSKVCILPHFFLSLPYTPGGKARLLLYLRNCVILIKLSC